MPLPAVRLILAVVCAPALTAPAAGAAAVLEHVSDHPTTNPDPDEFAASEGQSADGTRVFIETGESLLPADTDTGRDVYARNADGTALALLSDHPTTNPDANVNADLNGSAPAADGSRVFISTSESLLAADADTATDVYSSSPPRWARAARRGAAIRRALRIVP